MSDPSVIIDDICWTLSAAGQELLSPEQLSFASHQDNQRTTTIKHGQHRTVYCVRLDRVTVYWKHCRLNGSRAWWREVVRGPKAQLEWKKIHALAERGIASIEPLAWGRFVGRWPRGSFLITRELAHASPLDEWLQRSSFRSLDERRRFTERLAAWVAHIHQAGVLHPDFHPGNILVRQRDDDWQFFLIDVHDVELYDRLSPAQRERNLLLLNRWFQLRTHRPDRRRFWQTYQANTATTLSPQSIEEKTDRSNIQLWLARDQRCTRNNREFQLVRQGAYRGYAISQLPDEVRKIANNPEAPFHDLNNTLLKSGRTATVARINGEQPLIYKLFRIKEWYASLVNLIRPSPTLRSWRNGHAFRLRQLPTPLPLLMFHRYRLGPGEGYLVWTAITNAKHLHEVVDGQSLLAKRELIDQLARLIRLMHERGLSHRDLKPANILIDSEGAIHFIDLVGVKTHRRVISPQRCAHDLVRLNVGFLNPTTVTRTDRLRFLRMYMCWAMRGSQNWKEWWQRIRFGTQAKIRKNAKRNRPLS